MRKAMVPFLGLLLLMSLPVFARAQDGETIKDNPYFSKLPGYEVAENNDRDFDAHTFYDGKKEITLEGKLYSNTYHPTGEAKPMSNLQVRRNYAAAIRNFGGTVLYEGDDAEYVKSRNYHALVTGRASKGDKDIWIEVFLFDYGSGPSVWMAILEVEKMRQDVTASGLAEALNKEGHVALYINFDVNQATIRPESKAVVDQVAQMLKENPAIKVSIEGHTDSTGDAKKNRKLSEDRAKAVQAAIVAQGIDAKRLATTGWGQEKPIADNNTEDGKAKNRRVELVKR